MRGIWKDGFRKFSRDANVWLRGIEGISDYAGYGTCGRGTKEFWGRQHNKGIRREARGVIAEELAEPNSLMLAEEMICILKYSPHIPGEPWDDDDCYEDWEFYNEELVRSAAERDEESWLWQQQG